MRFLALAFALSALAFAADEPRRGDRKGGGAGQGEGRLPTLLFRTEVPAQALDVILGRPTADGVTLSILSYEGAEGYVAFGLESASGELAHRTAPQKFAKCLPVEIALTGLRAGARYAWQFRFRAAGAEGAGEFRAAAAGSFTTARAPGGEFVFTVQADPHLDAAIDPEIYQQSLANVLAARADFHVDLGDTFMTDKRNDYRDALPQYLAQRYYFSLVGHSVPVFLVLGNHDGEQPGKGGGDAMALWSNAQRKKYFPNPEPNAFYTGNVTPHPQAGLLQNYYAFEWGDSLFVALDPYWYSNERNRGGDNWVAPSAGSNTSGCGRFWGRATRRIPLSSFTTWLAEKHARAAAGPRRRRFSSGAGATLMDATPSRKNAQIGTPRSISSSCGAVVAWSCSMVTITSTRSKRATGLFINSCPSRDIVVSITPVAPRNTATKAVSLPAPQESSGLKCRRTRRSWNMPAPTRRMRRAARRKPARSPTTTRSHQQNSFRCHTL